MKLHRTIPVLAIAAASVFALTACAGSADEAGTENPSSAVEEPAEEVEAAPEVVDLTGSWTQQNAEDPASAQTATITADRIEVYWNTEDTKALYWAGTFTAPEAGETSYTWDSAADREALDKSLLGSGDDSKTFTYADGEISYDVTAMGVTKTVKLAQD